ncbi:unnamed protein product [Rotaria magnacalcarata]|uniref:Uncharacterized protein n=1 Tax=Rotaria magnacalcarata TaxID=392030 RepID=A0A816YJ52_9BILA|nr:unnamed protein product [Rotaria magnacalcarata]CAF3832585.1 unnamed protein product [Rotaria magnacalcarata]
MSSMLSSEITEPFGVELFSSNLGKFRDCSSSGGGPSSSSSVGCDDIWSSLLETDETPRIALKFEQSSFSAMLNIPESVLYTEPVPSIPESTPLIPESTPLIPESTPLIPESTPSIPELYLLSLFCIRLHI